MMGEAGIRSWRRLWLSAAVCFIHAAPAAAQYSQALFLEVVRDPGRADLASTAKSLALAGVPVGLGTADAAGVSPGSLMLGTGNDLVVSYGSLFYARKELIHTPRQLPPFDPSRSLSARSATPVGYVAVATRRPRWAAAGFYDATSRYAHAFTTAPATLFSTSLFPTIIIETGTGAASISQSATRLGGSIAVGDQTRRLGLGVSAYLVRMNYLATATDTIEIRSSSFSNPNLTTFCCVVDRDRVEFREWAPGFAVSGVVTPIRHLTLAARWRHEPAFNAIRELSISRQSPFRFTQEVTFRLPGSYGVGAIATAEGTTVLVDLSRGTYAGVFSPLMSPTFDPNYICGQMAVKNCPGWNFAYHDTRDTTTVKAALEQTASAGPGRLSFRGGIAHEPAYTLARSAGDVSTRRTLSLPAPPVVSEFEPPRESSTWLSAGLAYAWRATEIGVGVARANHQTRLLLDVRVRSHR